MFDVGFGELFLCFVIALIVLGPERLPKVARMVGRWTGQARGYMRNLSAELERETHALDIKKQLEEANRMAREQVAQFHKEANSNIAEVKQALAPPAALPPPEAAAPPTEPKP
jgi:sec-independent protein translocase protein TatB